MARRCGVSAQKGKAEAAGEVLVTPRDLAERYRVTTQTILEWFHQGVIPARVAIGRVYRFEQGEVEAALREHAISKKGQVPGFVSVC